jgi:hypothetical protein
MQHVSATGERKGRLIRKAPRDSLFAWTSTDLLSHGSVAGGRGSKPRESSSPGPDLLAQSGSAAHGLTPVESGPIVYDANFERGLRIRRFARIGDRHRAIRASARNSSIHGSAWQHAVLTRLTKISENATSPTRSLL